MTKMLKTWVANGLHFKPGPLRVVTLRVSLKKYWILR